MKKRFLQLMVIKMLVLELIFIPDIITSPEKMTFVDTNTETEVTIVDVDTTLVGAGVHEAIQEEPVDIYMYSTTIVKVRRKPIAEDESNVVGLIPAGAEMLWLEDVDDMWSKVEINDVEYFICKDYITTITPENVISILNIEPTHEGVYFVNKSSGEEVSNPNYQSLGTFKLTAYCPCSKCCGKWANDAAVKVGAIGVPLVQGTSIAVDPKVIPYRSSVYIDGHEYKAHDCGGSIKGNRIDVYFEDHNTALHFGVQYKEVFIWKY